MSLTTHALDVGALTPFLWAFEERERLMEFYERISGARMHAAYIRPGGVSQEAPKGLLQDIFFFCERFSSRIDEIETLLTNNRIWKQRLINIGFISKKNALNFGFSGVLLRGSGVRWDLRKDTPYEVYTKVAFKVPYSSFSDCFDRYLLRIDEMRESLSIISQAILNMPPYNAKVAYCFNTSRACARNSMGHLIHHFNHFSLGGLVPQGEVFVGVEAPKGEFGIYIVSNNTGIPHRCRVKAPGFVHLQAITYLSKGTLISDVVTIIGSLDIVFGEVDR